LGDRFGPAYFRRAAYRDKCDQERHEKGVQRHALLLFILWERLTVCYEYGENQHANIRESDMRHQQQFHAPRSCNAMAPVVSK